MRPGIMSHSVKVLQGLKGSTSFSLRVAMFWNGLPTSIVIAPSVESVKRQLDSTWNVLFLPYVLSHYLHPRLDPTSSPFQYPA